MFGLGHWGYPHFTKSQSLSHTQLIPIFQILDLATAPEASIPNKLFMVQSDNAGVIELPIRVKPVEASWNVWASTLFCSMQVSRASNITESPSASSFGIQPLLSFYAPLQLIRILETPSGSRLLLSAPCPATVCSAPCKPDASSDAGAVHPYQFLISHSHISGTFVPVRTSQPRFGPHLV